MATKTKKPAVPAAMSDDAIDAAIAAYTETVDSYDKGFDAATGEFYAVYKGETFRVPTRMTLDDFDGIDEDATNPEQFRRMFPDLYDQMRGLPFAAAAAIIGDFFDVYQKVQRASAGKLQASLPKREGIEQQQ